MKLFFSVVLLVAYLFIAPNWFVEQTMSVYPLISLSSRTIEFLVMLGGVIAFVAFVPIEWLRRTK